MKQTLLQALVNPFAGKESGSPDNVAKQTPAELDKKVQRAYEKYCNLKYSDTDEQLPVDGFSVDIRGRLYEQISKLRFEPMTPAQIDLLLQKMIHGKTKGQLNQKLPGLFLSYQVQLSYNAGNNNFVFTTGDKAPVSNLLSDLGGSVKNPVKALINGNAGECLGENSLYIDAVVNGNCDRGLSDYSTNSSYCIKGDVVGEDWDLFAHLAKKCTYIFEGRLKQDFEEDDGAPRQCKFMTYIEKDYCALKKQAASAARKSRAKLGNKVILLK